MGDPNSEALATHRLTVDNVRRMFAVDRELLALMKGVPDLESRMDEAGRRIDPEQRLGVVDGSAKVHEAIPEIAAILRTHKMSGREYTLTHIVAMVTAMADDTLAYEVRNEGSKKSQSVFITPALKFWRSMDPALKAEAAEWKKLRGYDKGINR
jgi:hypothetical protein